MDMLPDGLGRDGRPSATPHASQADIRPRAVLVTGGTDGIGRAVALRLAREGHFVLITGRDHTRGADAVRQMVEVAPARQGLVATPAFLTADLSSMTQTRMLADAVAAVTGRLDALVCCAGAFTLRPRQTEEGLERSFALNYLSRFLLVRRLLPLLRRSTSGRVVLVANAGRYRDTLDLDKLRRGVSPHGLRLAGSTQFANDVLALELAERWRGTAVEVTCVNPGIVATDLFRHTSDLHPLLAGTLARLAARAGRHPDDAAQVPAWLATDPDATGVSGRFFGPRLRPVAPAAAALRPERRAEIWKFSEDLLHQLDHQARGSVPARPETARAHPEPNRSGQRPPEPTRRP